MDSLPRKPLYHEGSDLLSRAGYYPNLSDVQLAAAERVLAEVAAEQLQFNVDDEDVFLKALRFLRARKYDVDQAMVMIRNDVAWRAEGDRSQLRWRRAYDVLQCDLGAFFTYFPTWVQGYDKQSRPVAWRKFGKFEIWNVLKLTSMERLIDFHAWESEQLLRMMSDKSRELGVNIETFTIVIDADSWHIGLANRDAYTFIRAMASTDSDHYPERLGQLVVINAPTMLSLAWRVIQGFLDDVQKAKIKIYGTNRAEWLPVLMTIIDEDQIPQQYGGTMPDLNADLALSSMDPPGTTGTTQTTTATKTGAARSVGTTADIRAPVASPPPAPRVPARSDVSGSGRFSYMDLFRSPDGGGGGSGGPLPSPPLSPPQALTKWTVDAGSQTDFGDYAPASPTASPAVGRVTRAIVNTPAKPLSMPPQAANCECAVS